MAKKSFASVWISELLGLFLLIVGFAVFYFRPFQGCQWYQIFCFSGSLLTGWIFTIASTGLILIGILLIIIGALVGFYKAITS